MRVFLIGGGRGDDTTASHRPFVRSLVGTGPVLVYLLDDPDYRDALVDHGMDWLAAARAGGLPYAGLSAGAVHR